MDGKRVQHRSQGTSSPPRSDRSAAHPASPGQGHIHRLSEMQKGPPLLVALSGKDVRRRPTLPLPSGGSTIGAGRLNFRVRDGSGCFPVAMAAVTLVTHGCVVVWVEFWGVSSCGYGWVVWCWVVDARHLAQCLCWCGGVGQALGLLVPVGWALLLYTSGLSTPCSVGGLTRFVLWETLS